MVHEPTEYRPDGAGFYRDAQGRRVMVHVPTEYRLDGAGFYRDAQGRRVRLACTKCAVTWDYPWISPVVGCPHSDQTPLPCVVVWSVDPDDVVAWPEPA